MAATVRPEHVATRRQGFVAFRERASEGDVVVHVVKRRSSQHLPPKAKGAIRSLGLSGSIGRWNIQPDSLATWGQVAKVQSVVVARRVRLTAEGLEPAESSMRTQTYELRPGVGTQISSEGQPLAWVEEREIGHTVTWLARPGVSPDVLAKRVSALFDLKLSRLAIVAYDLDGNQLDVREGQVGRSYPVDDLRVVVLTPTKSMEVLWQRSFTDPSQIEIGVVGEAPGDRRTVELARLTGVFALSHQITDFEMTLNETLSDGR